MTDRTAATLAIVGRAAAAALAVVDSGPYDTVLIGGAEGGVGVSLSSWPGSQERA
ncbi:hypothetical protein [Amycolatopsis taiwanensis]|uniref:Uncharacterized protein n=1 Tax=Amycolatopsis taiwanensis TaxID=342230 RepID=A0A9W6QVE5_9PSEU|nr:hypothetical protein [Amycolatopsis taiwanensis]GLY64751.1 hypothetical protein Atai01_13700 [Amycolatopsis taiwanensis]